jgi:hypothetical protein
MLYAFVLTATLAATGSVQTVSDESAPTTVVAQFRTPGDAWLERLPVLYDDVNGHADAGWHSTISYGRPVNSFAGIASAVLPEHRLVSKPVFRVGPKLNQRAFTGQFLVIRGQNPAYDETPQLSPDLSRAPIIVPPATRPAPWAQPQMGWPGAGLLAPNGWPGGPAPNASVVGVNGPQPFRFGWQSRLDIGYLPTQSVSRSNSRGSLGIFETNLELRYTAPIPGQWILSIAPQFNLRGWDGPGSPAANSPRLDGEAIRFGSDFRLTSPTVGPTTFEIGFTPALSSDLERSLSSDAWSFDAYGALQIRTSPNWLVVVGALFWDRVNDRVLPYGGLVYTPNGVFEARLLFPRADVSVFVGAPWGVPQWLYLAAEYHVEAWEVDNPLLTPAVGRRTADRFEMEDWRLLFGVRSESVGVSSFLEAGWVFGRHADFLNTAADFDISSGFITRFGVRW